MTMLRVSIVLVAVILLSAGKAQATLIGDHVSAFYEDPLGHIQSQQGPALVSGTQILALQHTLITVTASQVIYNFSAGWGFPSDPFSGIALFDYTHAFTSARLASSSFSLPAADVSLAGGYIYLNLAGYSGARDGGTSARIVVNVNPTTITPAPEPAAIGVFGIGLLGLTLGRRSRYRRA